MAMGWQTVSLWFYTRYLCNKVDVEWLKMMWKNIKVGLMSFKYLNSSSDYVVDWITMIIPTLLRTWGTGLFFFCINNKLGNCYWDPVVNISLFLTMGAVMDGGFIARIETTIRIICQTSHIQSQNKAKELTRIGLNGPIWECEATGYKCDTRFLTYCHLDDAHLALGREQDLWRLVCQGSCEKTNRERRRERGWERGRAH